MHTGIGLISDYQTSERCALDGRTDYLTIKYTTDKDSADYGHINVNTAYMKIKVSHRIINTITAKKMMSVFSS